MLGQHRPVIRLASLYNGITLQNELWGYSVCGAGHHFDLVYSDGTVLLCDFPSFKINGQKIQRWSIVEKPTEGKPAA